MKDKIGLVDKILLKLIKKRKLADNLKLKDKLVNVVIERRNHYDGSVIDREELHNLITNAGKVNVAKLLGDVDSVSHFSYIAIGTGVTGADVGDTGCETEVDRQACSPAPSYEASYKCVFERTFTFDSGESYAITEAVLSDSAGASGESILDRFVFSAKNVDADTDIYCKITITVAS